VVCYLGKKKKKNQKKEKKRGRRRKRERWCCRKRGKTQSDFLNSEGCVTVKHGKKGGKGDPIRLTKMDQ